MSVGREAIGADDRGAVVAEQLIDDLPTAAPANGEYRDPSCDHHPQPSPEATLPPAGLVEVDRRLLANVSPRGFDGLGDRRRYLLFQLADRARTQVHAEGVGQQRDDVALAQAVGARQQTDPGLHTGPEGPARHTLRPGRFGQSVAMPAAQGMELILDDLGSHRRDHDLLVTQRMGIVAAQRLTASAARARLDRHQLVHLLHRHQRATVAFVTRLTSRRPTRRSTLAGATRALRGRLRRRCPGAATAPSFSARQLRFQRRDPRGLLLHYLLEVRDSLHGIQQVDHQRLHRLWRASPVAVRDRWRGLIHGVASTRRNVRTNQPIPRYQRTPKQNSSFSNH